MGKKIAVLGCGLGYSLSCILGAHGHDVVGVDINPIALKNPRLDEGMKQHISQHQTAIKRNVSFTTNYNKIDDRELIFIFVATPLEGGRLSTRYIEDAIMCSLERNSDAHFVLLSTMPIGGCDRIFQLFPKLKNKLNYVPPQVRQSFFYETFTKPPTSWQMISDNADWKKIIQIYKPILDPKVRFIVTDYKIVETAKLVVNAFLANKIIFANAVDDWCKQRGDVDAKEIMQIVGGDPRIGNRYIAPNGAVGGSCLPRDMIELSNASFGTPFKQLLDVLRDLNDKRAIRNPSPIPTKY